MLIVRWLIHLARISKCQASSVLKTATKRAFADAEITSGEANAIKKAATSAVIRQNSVRSFIWDLYYLVLSLNPRLKIKNSFVITREIYFVWFVDGSEYQRIITIIPIYATSNE